MVEKSEIERLVAEEIARPEIQAAITQAKGGGGGFWSGVVAFSKNPMLVAILGFVLTSFVGTFIGQEYSERQLRDTQTRNALEAVRSFATTASELRVAQNNLQDALARGAGADELTGQKSSYDAAFSAWSSGLYANALATREFFGFTYDNFAEQVINRTLHQYFKAYRACLHDAYKQATTPAAAASTAGLTETNIDACLKAAGVPGAGSGGAWDERERIFQCSRDIFDTLNHYIARDLNCTTSTWNGGAVPSGVQAAYDVLMDKCGAENTEPYNPHTNTFAAYCTIEPPGLIRSLFR